MSNDGYTLLGTIAGAPDVFPDVRAEAAKAARALIVKQLKAKTLPLSGLRRVHDSIGETTFKHVVGEMKDAEVKSLVARLDKDNAAMKAADGGERVRRLLALAAGAEPAAKAAKPPREKAAKPPGSKAPKATRALGSPAFSAVWDGKDHDAPEAKSRKK